MNRIPFNTGWMCRPAASEAEEVPVTIPHDAMQWDPKSADSPSGVNSGWYSARDYLLYLVVFRFGLTECLEIEKRWYFNAFAIL